MDTAHAAAGDSEFHTVSAKGLVLIAPVIAQQNQANRRFFGGGTSARLRVCKYPK